MPVQVNVPPKPPGLAANVAAIWEQAAELFRQAKSGLNEASSRSTRYKYLYWSLGASAVVVAAIAAATGLKDLVPPIAVAVIGVLAAALAAFMQFASPRKGMSAADSDKNTFWEVIRDLQTFLRIGIANQPYPQALSAYNDLEDKVDSAFRKVYGIRGP